MLASPGLTEASEDDHRLDARTVVLSVVTAAVTLAVFTGGGAVAWAEGGVTPWSTDATAMASISRTRSGVVPDRSPTARAMSSPKE